MHTENLDLNLLAVLDALLREGSVTKAAHSLGLTQSATSHALIRLREFFEDPLFVKVRSGNVVAEMLREHAAALVANQATTMKAPITPSHINLLPPSIFSMANEAPDAYKP